MDKNEPRYVVFQHRFQESQSVCGIVTEVDLRLLHRFARFDQGRKVHHSVESALTEHAVETCRVADIADDELSLFGHGQPVASGQVVENRYPVALLQ